MTGALPLDGFAEAAGQILARARREWQAERELAQAETRRTIAELEARVATLTLQVRDMVAERMAAVRDGRDGRDGQPGKDADPALIEGLVAESVGRAVAAIPAPKDGKDGVSVDPASVEQIVFEKVAIAVAALPLPENGKDADPALIAEMVAVEVAKLPPAEPGKSVDPAWVTMLVSAEVELAAKSLPVPADGHTPTEAELAPLVETAVSRAVSALPVPRDGVDGKDGIDGAAGRDGIDGKSVEQAEVERLVAEAVAQLPPPERGEKGDPGDSVVGPQGERGERGPEGPPGKLPLVKAWQRGVHYEGDVRTHDGSTYQAQRDTAEEPPHEDWIVLAARGAEPYVGEVRGVYDPAAKYRKFDLVTMNGSEWRAKKDNPGSPGEGPDWALAAKVGKRGDLGPKGDRGPSGRDGSPAPTIRAWEKRGYEAIPVMSDGTLGPALDVRDFFELYHDEAR